MAALQSGGGIRDVHRETERGEHENRRKRNVKIPLFNLGVIQPRVLITGTNNKSSYSLLSHQEVKGFTFTSKDPPRRQTPLRIWSSC